VIPIAGTSDANDFAARSSTVVMGVASNGSRVRATFSPTMLWAAIAVTQMSGTRSESVMN